MTGERRKRKEREKQRWKRHIGKVIGATSSRTRTVPLPRAAGAATRRGGLRRRLLRLHVRSEQGAGGDGQGAVVPAAAADVVVVVDVVQVLLVGQCRSRSLS